MWRREGSSKCCNSQNIPVYHVVEKAGNGGIYNVFCFCSAVFVGRRKARGRQRGLRPLFAFAFVVTETRVSCGFLRIGFLADAYHPDEVFVFRAKNPWPKPNYVHGLWRFGKGRASMAKT